MNISYNKNFIKNYKRRISTNKKLITKFEQQYAKFIKNRNDPTLNDHKLMGKMGKYRSFSITGDIRIAYKIVGNDVLFYDIGSHNQVY